MPKLIKNNDNERLKPISTNNKETFYDVCREGNIDKVLKQLNENKCDVFFCKWTVNSGLTGSAHGNHREIVDQLIKFLKDHNLDIFYDWGLYGAVKGGNIDMTMYMIERGASNFDEILPDAMRLNTDLAIRLIELGADPVHGMHCIIALSNMPMFDYLLSRYDPNINQPIPWVDLLDHAFKKSDLSNQTKKDMIIHIVELIRIHLTGEERINCLNYGRQFAKEAGYDDLVLLMKD